MTGELKSAIERLYQTFAIYPCKSTMEGCPCCVSGSDKEKIHSKHLKQLEEGDLAKYASKAMTTWGDTEDYKHYLPRIFELLATTGFIVDTFIVLGKLEYGQWKNWPEYEKDAIVSFLFAWWPDYVKNNSRFDKETFVEICKLTHDIDKLLNLWTISFIDSSFNNFVELVYDYYNDLTGKRKEFKELDDETIKKLIDWIKKNSTVLENGFFHYESSDKKFAEKVSATLYIFERMA